MRVGQIGTSSESFRYWLRISLGVPILAQCSLFVLATHGNGSLLSSLGRGPQNLGSSRLSAQARVAGQLACTASPNSKIRGSTMSHLKSPYLAGACPGG